MSRETVMLLIDVFVISAFLMHFIGAALRVKFFVDPDPALWPPFTAALLRRVLPPNQLRVFTMILSGLGLLVYIVLLLTRP